MTGLLRILRLPSIRNALLLRGFLVWVGVRVAALWVRIDDPNFLQSIWILGAVALIVFLDARRREEDVFLANLGVPGGVIAVAGLPLPLLLEVLL